MSRGRKPKATHLKLVTGNAGKRAINKDEPQGNQPTVDELAVPEEIEGNLAAVAWWERNVPKLAGIGIVKDLDLSLCVLAAVAWSNFLRGQDLVMVHGMTQQGEHSTLKHPGTNIAREWLVTYRHCCAELGLSPSSRAKLGGNGEDDDGLDDFLQGARPG